MLDNHWPRRTLQRMSHLVLSQLRKSFARRGASPIVAVDQVTLGVEPGERLAIVGPSGSGKTTLLRLIAGLESPDHGSITLAGKSMAGVPPKARDIGMVFQSPALLPHLSVFGNLELGLRLRHVPRAERESRVSEMLALLQLEARRDALPETLSGGEQQRIALGRALVRRPAVLLLDEPLAGLDAPLRLQLRRELVRVHRHLGTTLLHVTHDQSEAMALGERVAVMKEGNVIQLARPDELYARPATLAVAQFIGDPAMNLLEGLVQADATECTFVVDSSAPEHGGKRFEIRLSGAKPAPLGQLAGKRSVLGIHPWHVLLQPHGNSSNAGDDPDGLVEGIENRGADQVVSVRLGRQSLLATVSSTSRFAVGDRVRMQLDPEFIRLFDPTTGECWRGFQSTPLAGGSKP